jgi:hypothetical protein
MIATVPFQPPYSPRTPGALYYMLCNFPPNDHIAEGASPFENEKLRGRYHSGDEFPAFVDF